MPSTLLSTLPRTGRATLRCRKLRLRPYTTMMGTKWESLSGCTTGTNAWLFVDENIKAVKELQKMRKKGRGGGVEVQFASAVLDGKYWMPRWYGAR